MALPIKIISTDFDGTLHAEFEEPPVPVALEQAIGQLQRQGAAWVINTGRDLPSLLESLGQARLSICPDYVVAVEREIYARQAESFVGLEDWNTSCEAAHREIFDSIRPDVPELATWITSRFEAKVYADAYSPLCLIAQSSTEADVIHDYLNAYCRNVPNLTVVRNHVYARFCHAAYNKGSALSEISRRAGVSRDHVVAAGDHLNDLPMLTSARARWLIAPSNAVEEVKEQVRQQNGYVSVEPHGHGLAWGLRRILSGCPGD
ncbi:MAG: HAD family phosphatase [Verrucomicrobia bacterium]|nr:HAD family phosphatase [Verrucomicrobiota bacterium]